MAIDKDKLPPLKLVGQENVTTAENKQERKLPPLKLVGADEPKKVKTKELPPLKLIGEDELRTTAVKPSKDGTLEDKELDTEEIKIIDENPDIDKVEASKKKEDIRIKEASRLTGYPEEVLRNFDLIGKIQAKKKPEKEKAASYIGTFANGFNRSAAEALRTIDGAIGFVKTGLLQGLNLAERAAGKPEAKRTQSSSSQTMLSSIAETLDIAADGGFATPDNVGGDIAEGAGALLPDIIATMAFPEVKLAGVAKWTKGIITKVPAFPNWLGIKGAVHAYLEPDSDPFSVATEYGKGFSEGMVYEGLGVLGNEAKLLAQDLGAGKAVSELSAGIANGTLFGGHSVLTDPEVFNNGEIDWDLAKRRFGSGFGMGMMFHLKGMYDGVKSGELTRSMVQKSYTSYMTSDKATVRNALAVDKTPTELRKISNDYWREASAAKTDVEANQYYMAKSAIDNIILTKFTANDVAKRPDTYKKIINEDKTLSDKQKSDAIKKIDETVEDFNTVQQFRGVKPDAEIKTETVDQKGLQEKLDEMTAGGKDVTKTPVGEIDKAYKEFKEKETAKETKEEVKTEELAIEEIETKEESEPTGPIIPAETLSSANKAFEASKENMSEANAAVESFKTVERSDWYGALDKEQKKTTKEKYFNEIAERFIPIPEKRVKSKVQTLIDKFVNPKKINKVTVNEYAALKSQIKLEMRAAKEGSKKARGDIKESQEALLDYIKSEIYESKGRDVGKGALKSLLTAVKNTKNYEALDAQIAKVDKVIAGVKDNFVNRSKAEILEFVGKGRTVSLSGKKKARGGDAFSIPYFSKAKKVIKEINTQVANAKLLSADRMATKLKSELDATPERKREIKAEEEADRMATEDALVESKIVDMYTKAKKDLIYGSDALKARAEAEIEAISDFRYFNSLDSESIGKFTEKIKDIDKTGRVRLKEQIRKEAERLTALSEKTDRALLDPKRKVKTRTELSNRGFFKKIKDGIVESKRGAMSFVENPISHVKTLLEFMSTEIAPSGEGVLIKETYDRITKADSQELDSKFKSSGAIKERFRARTESRTDKELTELDNRMNKVIYINSTRNESGREEVTVGEAMKVYAWSKNKALRKELLEKDGVTKEEIDRIKTEIGEDLVGAVDDVVKFMDTKYVNSINDIYKKLFRIDFPSIRDYFPVRREGVVDVPLTEDQNMYSVLSSTMAQALSERTKTGRRLEFTSDEHDVSFLSLISKNIDEIEHFKAFAEVAKDVDAIMNTEAFKQRANDRLGSGTDIAGRVIRKGGHKLITDLLRQSINKNIYNKSYLGSGIIQAVGVSTLGFKPKQTAVQLSSYVSAVEKFERADGGKFFGHNTLTWVGKSTKLLANPFAVGKLTVELRENSPKLRARWDKYTKSDPDLIRKASGSNGNLVERRTALEKIGRFSMKPVEFGDVGAIILGYGPVYMEYKKMYTKKYGAKEGLRRAILKFETYEESQQTRSDVLLSEVQLKGSFGNKVLTTFKSSQILNLNNAMQAVNGLKRTVKGRKTVSKEVYHKSMKKDIKKLLVYHSLVSMSYQAISSGATALIRGDSDDFWNDQIRAGLLGSFNGLFVLSDIFESIADRAQGKNFGDKGGIKILAPIKKAVDVVFEEDPDFLRASKEVAYFMMSLKGIPAQNIEDVGSDALDFLKYGDTDSFLGAMGWSDYAITGKTKTERNKAAKKEAESGTVPYR